MLGAILRLFWNSSKRVMPATASRRTRMLHHSPTRPRLRAIAQSISTKLVFCMSTSIRLVTIIMQVTWVEERRDSDRDLEQGLGTGTWDRSEGLERAGRRGAETQLLTEVS